MAKFLLFLFIAYVFNGSSADKVCSDPNEEYKLNIKKCQKDLCSSIVSKFACDPKDEGQSGCFCKSGFLRLTQNSSCIPTNQCPELANSPNNQNTTCDENETMNTCPLEKCEYCPTSDEEARACLTASQDSCPPPKCTCRNNYRRLQNRTCIPTRQCPSFHCPQLNEVFNPCPPCASDSCSRATPDGSCKVIGHIGIPLQCRPSCRCKKNYWRDGERCVPYENCPNIQTNLKCSLPNESLQCVRPCPPLGTCENRDKIFECPMFNSSTPCKNVCACNKGFYRNSDGLCVTSNLCDNCTKPNESLKCVTSCPRPSTCIGRYFRYKCFNNTKVCKNECVCDDGFYRNSDGFCVTSDLCDKKCLGLHEEYTPNKTSCSPDICRSLIRNYQCGPKDQGQPGCVCKAGFLRMTLNSPCIPKEECPEFGTTPDSGGKCEDPDKDSQLSDEKRPVDFDLEYWTVYEALPRKQIDKDTLSSI